MLPYLSHAIPKLWDPLKQAMPWDINLDGPVLKTGCCHMQAGEEPLELSAAEKARQQALDSGDIKAAPTAEMQIVVALLRSQFGPADVDHEAGIIFLRVCTLQNSAHGMACFHGICTSR